MVSRQRPSDKDRKLHGSELELLDIDSETIRSEW